MRQSRSAGRKIKGTESDGEECHPTKANTMDIKNRGGSCLSKLLLGRERERDKTRERDTINQLLLLHRSGAGKLKKQAKKTPVLFPQKKSTSIFPVHSDWHHLSLEQRKLDVQLWKENKWRTSRLHDIFSCLLAIRIPKAPVVCKHIPFCLYLSTGHTRITTIHNLPDNPKECNIFQDNLRLTNEKEKSMDCQESPKENFNLNMVRSTARSW